MAAVVLLTFAAHRSGLAQSGDNSAFEGDETFTHVGDFGQLKGERIDPRTRTLEWRNEDLLVPGNGGLPLRIGRVQPNPMKARYESLFLSDWDLDIPRIVRYVPPGPWFEGADHCNSPELTGGRNYTDPQNPPDTVFIWDFNFAGPLMLSMPGAAPELMLVKLPGATQFPAAAKYVTTNNTYVECPTGGNGYIVHTPDGTTYHLTEHVSLFGDWTYGNWGGQIVFVPTQITDARGNTLTFEYSARVTDGTGSRVSLSRIQASDGRVVDFSYYPSGGSLPRIQKITFDGKEWNFSYTTLPSGWIYLSQVTDPVGRAWQYYFANGDWTVTLPTGGVVHYDYQNYCPLPGVCGPVVASRTITGAGVPSGSVWTFGYSLQSSDKEVATVTGPDRTVRHTYRRGHNDSVDMRAVFDSGQLLKAEILEPNGTVLRTTDYVHTALPQIGLYNQPAGPMVMQFQASPVRVTSRLITDNLTGQIFDTDSTNFDVFGNPQTVTEDGTLDRQTNITYVNTTTPWIVGLRNTETIVGIGVIDRDYFANGLLQKLDRYGVVETYEYHSTGDLYKKKWVRDGVPHEVVYSDYYRGVARSEAHPEAVSISRTVNATGTVQSETDGKGYQTSFVYDGVNRLTQETPPEGAVTVINWISPTQVLTTRGAYRRQRWLDALGRIVLDEVWDQSWSAGQHIYRRRAYDAESRIQFESVASYNSAEGAGVQYSYDALDRAQLATNTVDSTSKAFCYGNGCRIQTTEYPVALQFGFIETDERGYDTAYEYDAFGDPDERVVSKISRQVRAAGEAGGLKFIDTGITHTDAGEIDTVTQGGFSRQHIYNPQRQLWRLIEPETGTTEMTYDSVGNLKTRKVGTSGTTVYTYDGLNRRRAIDYPGTTPDVLIDYDKNDNLDVVTSGNTVWDYSFDGLDRLQTESLAVNGQTFGFSYQYASSGGLASATYPSGATITFAPDGLGRPTAAGSYVTLAAYHPDGTPQLIRYGNGQEATYSLTARRQIDQYTTTDGFRSVVNLNHDYDSVGNVGWIANYLDPSKHRSLQYDGAGRLVTANGHWGAGSMTYDDVGNLKTMSLGGSSLTYWYDGQNRLDYTTGSVAYDYSYDVYGNATGNGFDVYAFNTASQLTGVPSIPGTSYSYDGNGMRTMAVTTSGTTYSAYGLNGQLLLTKDSSSDITSEHYYLGSRLVAKRDYGTGVDDDLDDDGITDDVELMLGLNPSSASDAQGDLDGDGASNLAEYQARTLLNGADTDSDGINDGYELRYGLNARAADAGFDPDGDGLTNLQEFQLNTNPFDTDTDNDGVADNLDPAPTFNPALIPIIDFLLSN